MSKNSKVINVEIDDVNERIDTVTRLIENQRPNEIIVVSMPKGEFKLDDIMKNNAHD